MDAKLKSGHKYDIIINPPEFHISQDLTEQQKEENKQKMVKFLQTAIQIGNLKKYESIAIPACLKSMKNLKPKTEIFQAIFDAIDQYDLSKQSSSGSLKVIKIILEDEQESELFNAISQKMYIQRKPYSLLIEDHMKKEEEKQSNEISELNNKLQLIIELLSPKMKSQKENLHRGFSFEDKVEQTLRKLLKCSDCENFQTFDEQELIDHQDNFCGIILLECDFCFNKYDIEYMEVHVQYECEENYVDCQYCQDRIIKYQIGDHEQAHQEQIRIEEENLKLFSQHEQQAAELQVYELIKFQQVQKILKKQEEEDFLFAQMIDQQSDRSDLANKLVPIVVGENQIESNKNQVDEVQNNQESSERDDEVQKEKVCLLCNLEIQEVDICHKLLCGHEFHKSCSEEWLIKCYFCPECHFDQRYVP
ncbi:uncharacterized protein tcm_011394 [Stylonychia lemnae]|uniref:Uncharacterized protein tcm_011394 n=1 Tax=Stylonychia lemnae TaxID=5949 RepID=A0A078B7H7_STYLE|nr:uncharacterized protein tcm_011394 [Stylonychia lemnae]|eukprot:CDW90450.1 uncharacterized protein tcm_011394 [Stylonychia lemnae]